MYLFIRIKVYLPSSSTYTVREENGFMTREYDWSILIWNRARTPQINHFNLFSVSLKLLKFWHQTSPPASYLFESNEAMMQLTWEQNKKETKYIHIQTHMHTQIKPTYINERYDPVKTSHVVGTLLIFNQYSKQWMDGWMDRRTDEQTNGSCLDEWATHWMYRFYLTV